MKNQNSFADQEMGMSESRAMVRMRKTYRFILLVMSIGGGLYGIGIAMYPFLHGDVDGIVSSMILGYGVLGFIFVTAAGIILWRNPTQIGPLRLALAAQVPWVSFPGVVYKFAAGLLVTVTLVANHHGAKYSAGFNADFLVGSCFEVRIFQMAPIEIGTNVVALALLWMLSKMSGKAAQQNVEGGTNAGEPPHPLADYGREG